MAKKKKSLADELLEEPLVKSNTTKKQASASKAPIPIKTIQSQQANDNSSSFANIRRNKTSNDIAPVRKTSIFSDDTKQAVKNQIFDQLNVNKIKDTWSDGYQFGDVTKTILNVKSLFNPAEKITSGFNEKANNFTIGMVNDIKEGKNNYIKASKGIQEAKNIWSDGYDFGDISRTKGAIAKTILGTGADVTANLAKGELQTAEGLVDTSRYIISDIAKAMGNKEYSKNVKERAIQNTTGVIFGENDLYNNPKDKGWLKRLDEYSVIGNQIDNVVQSLGQQAFRFGLQGAVGGIAGKAGMTQADITKAQKIFNNVEIFAGAYGSAKSDAYTNGADDSTATLRGLISGTAEYLSEHLDENRFLKTGSVTNVGGFKSTIIKGVEKAFGSENMGRIASGVFSSEGEAFEERLSNILETLGTDAVNYFYSDYNYGMKEGEGLDKNASAWQNVKKLLEDAYKSGTSEESKESANSARWSTLLTFGLAQVNTNISKNQAVEAVAKDNNISKEQATKIYDAVLNARTNEITDETTARDEYYTTKDNVSKELSQSVQNGDLNLVELNKLYNDKQKLTEAVGAGIASSAGLNLVESYKAYNGEKKYTKEITNIQKFMNNRNIDARFDATMFDNNEQNAIWTTQDGKDAVIFNPNASADQVIQNIATHEMTHDIINQKTEAGTSLFNDVLENIKSQENYAEQRQEIEDLYAKYYDRNSEDFSAKVDEEMVANELGKNLGTQEYINRLVNEKPNLARRIYNWVVDKLDNIGKSEEYKEQKKYWKSVADKFEVAYNEQKTATREDKTAYSLLENKKEFNLGTYQENLSKTDKSYKYNKVYQYDIKNGGRGDNVQVSVTPTGYVWNNAMLSDNIKGKGEGTKIALDLNQQSIEETGYPLKSLPEYNIVGTKNHTEEGKGLWDSLVRKGYAIKNNDNSYTMLKTAPTEQEIYSENNAKYSLTKDSQGRTLSKEQQEYFKDSKVRDSEGNLMVMYHGTESNVGLPENEKFSVFDRDRAGSHGTYYGAGFYFTPNIESAQDYAKSKGDVYQTYLDMKNPYIPTSDTINEDGTVDFAPNFYEDFENRFKDQLPQYWNDENTNKGRVVRNILEDNGYDGVINGDTYVVFNSNQIKNVDNTNPTGSEDIRYSLSPKGEMVDNKGNKVTLEASEVETNIPIRDDAKLMAIHNLNESKLNGILDLGGLPVPSIAIMNTETNGHNEFGDMSLIFDKSTIDPKNRKNEVYDRDVWSPTFPRVEYEVNEKSLDNIRKSLNLDYNVDHDSIQSKAILDLYTDRIENLLDSGDLERVQDEIKANRDIQYSYLKQKGLIQPVYKQVIYNNRFSNDMLNQFLNEYQGLTDFSWNTPLNELTYEQTMELGKPIQRIVKPYYDNEIQNIRDNKDLSKDAKQKAIDLMEQKYNDIPNNYGTITDFIYSAQKMQRQGYDVQEIDEYATLQKVSDVLNKEEYDNWVDNTFTEELIKDKGIRNDKDIFTPSGNRRSFKATHVPLNLENITKALTKKDTKGGQEMTIFGTGFGRINAQTANRFNSIEDIRANQNRLMTREQATEIIEPMAEKLFTDVDKLTNYYTRQDYKSDIANNMQAMDTTSQIIEEFAGKKLDTENLKKILSEYNVYDVESIPQDVLNDIVEDLKQLKDLPTDYFEAKPQRAVGLDEIQMAVIPNTASQELKQRLQDNNIKYTEYDPSIEGDRNRVVNQFNDLKFSMQQEETPFTNGTRTTIGELFNEVAPIREDLSNITEQMNNLSNQLETMQESLENTSKGYVETYNEQRNENIPTRNLTEEDANTLQDALMQDEGYLRSLNEEANLNTENTQLIDRLTNNVSQKLDLDRNQKETLRNIINESVENGYSADEISEALQKEFSMMSYEMTNQEAVDARKLIRDMPIKVSNAIKTDIADYGKWKQSNFGKINFSNNGGDVDTVYAELSSRMPYFFPSDIVNPTDQLLQIAEVANMATKTTETIDIDADEFDNIADYIKNTQLDDEYNAQLNSQYDLDKNIQFDMNEDIAPTTIRTQDSIDDYIENRDIAPVKPDKTQQRQETMQNISKIKRILSEAFVNRNYVIDQEAKKTGNKYIRAVGDMYNNARGLGDYNVTTKQTDMYGNEVGKGLDEIFEPIEKAGLGRAFDDYLFNKSNIERHNVGKGTIVPVEVSRQLVAQYERENPSFKPASQEVYNFINNFSLMEVDSGILAKEKYDDFRGEFGIYGEYVPLVYDNIDKSRYFDDSGEAKSVSTFKRSKGGGGDINQLLPMKEAIANQSKSAFRAVWKNELLKQIIQSNEQFSEAMDMDTRTSITNLDDSLYVTPDGDYIASAYVDGEKISAKISEELYNELTGENEQRIAKLENDLSLITKPLQWLSNVRRKLVTNWSLTFPARNAIKDASDAPVNSKHTKDWIKNYPTAYKELSEAKTKEAKQFLALYGSELYGDYSNKSNAGKMAQRILNTNELIELAPRFAEFKASVQNGETAIDAIYNAREVTTNFGRGGYITRALNRNGFTFLNANVQGLSKLVRNLSGENGVKGVTSVVVKGALFAVIPSIINHLLYGLGDDKDEEYEAIPDYIKDNYFLIKTEGNNFVRIPKGRINAVFGSLARRMIEAGEGEGFDFKEWGENAWNQIGVGDSSGIQTIFTPLRQAFGSKNGEAWYGGDIVPTRLQNKPAGEQTDAKIDAVSNFIGENLGISPYKINYVLDQYSGGIGDVILPYITPETKNGAETFGEHLVAPIKDAFVVNSTDDNKYAGDFYDLKDKLEIQSNSEKATDDDKIKYKYMSEVSKKMGDLYKEKREVQADTTLGNKAKYEKVQKIQNEINSLAKEGLSTYQSANTTENYSEIGDTEYYKNAKNEWTKVNEDEQEFTAGLNTAEKDSYFKAKNKIYGITQKYSNKLKGLDKDDPSKPQIYADKKEDITKAIVNSGLDNQMKAMVYSKYYSNQDTMTNVVNAGYDVDTYITALNDIDQLRTKYSKKNGYTTEERKQKTIAYINSLNMEIPQKAMMIRNYYTSFRNYNNDIVNYVANLNISYEDKKAILEGTGMTVNGNSVSWK